VCNPANEGERFCESFKSDEHYETFVTFVDHFIAEVVTLLSTTGFQKLDPALAKMFGERITKRALLEYGNRVTASREGGGLRTDPGSAGLALGATVPAVSAPARTTVPKNTFFGE
jgi:hypothetical protein